MGLCLRPIFSAVAFKIDMIQRFTELILPGGCDLLPLLYQTLAIKSSTLIPNPVNLDSYHLWHGVVSLYSTPITTPVGKELEQVMTSVRYLLKVRFNPLLCGVCG